MPVPTPATVFGPRGTNPAPENTGDQGSRLTDTEPGRPEDARRTAPSPAPAPRPRLTANGSSFTPKPMPPKAALAANRGTLGAPVAQVVETNDRVAVLPETSRFHDHIRAHSCLRKDRHPTQAVAFGAAHKRMATEARVPLYVYACEYCGGFHLTKNGDFGALVPPEAYESSEVGGPADYFAPDAVGRFNRQWALDRYMRRRRRNDRAKAKREDLAERKLARTKPPVVATAEEVEAFFHAARKRGSRVEQIRPNDGPSRSHSAAA